tara:strand:- start:271 stop:672 length:402 start_codon:yes stop_codon:yes gene_type:complete
MTETESIKIKGKVYWAQLNKLNDMSSKYQVNLGNLSDIAVAALESAGLKVDEKAGMGKFILCKSDRPIKAFYEDTELDAKTLIGNESEFKALIKPYEWSYKGKAGKSPSLRKLVITNLIEFGGGDLNDDDDVL